MPVYEVAFAAASSDVSTWHKMRISPNGSDYSTGNSSMSQQIATFTASGSATGAAGILGIAWVDPNAATNKIIKYKEATITVNARRSNLANAAANDFLTDITFADLTDKLDLLLDGENQVTVVGATDTSRAGPIEVRMGLVSAGGLGIVTVRYALTRAV